MRVLFCCRPAYGHVYPLLPLAAACRDVGHDVLWGTGEGFVKRLEAFGFRVQRVGISIPEADERVLREQPELGDLPREERFRIGVAVFGDVLPRHTIADLLPLLHEAAPDLVVYDETDAGAPIAAAIAGIPATAHSLGRQVPEMVRRAVVAPLHQVWHEYDPGAAPHDFFTANAYIDICPPSLQDPDASHAGERILLRPDSPPDVGGELPDWVTGERSRPLVYVTLGTYVHGQVDSLRAAVEGLGALAVDALVTVGPDGDPAGLGPLPDSVRVERFVSQAALLARVDVVAHHCGSGTMLGALWHGLPQLAMPHGADQFANAQALLDSGAGRRLLPEEITAEAVAEAVRALLVEPEYREAARGLAAEIAAMPSPTEVVCDLERLRAG
ncbi:glycosyltransferase [Capillimicrobium parvum]|uniref:4'-demethylrebeccamycin synthase n=1 Tax=Capillimicrobium parvum TaxID=2884022 RepID=A0A9E7C0Y2_9ACTN|nr:glycosyltransferase [Capillimicrobium parvum]UGS36089.1 4'-demethylrebeccamycin synthase [Capillimicrobium parvum]